MRVLHIWTHALLTCTGETMLEDVAAALVTPGTLPSRLECVSFPPLLFHPGVPLSGGEDGPHIRWSESPLPASVLPPRVSFHPRLLSSLGGPWSLAPSRLQALQAVLLRGRMPPDNSRPHGALVGLGDPHFGSRRRPRSLRGFVRRAAGGYVDINGLYVQRGAVGHRGARGGVFTTLERDVKHPVVQCSDSSSPHLPP